MSKKRVTYICRSCGCETGKWMGRCPHCGEWNTISAATEADRRPSDRSFLAAGESPEPLTDEEAPEERIRLPYGELERVLGGGLVPGSVILLGGEPGIGKSTLLLQLAASLAGGERAVLYVSGEESRRQVQLRARRLRIEAARLYFCAETDLERIIAAIEQLNPILVIIDSIQTVVQEELPLAAGSIAQLRLCTARLVREAKTRNVACFLVGHVTKEGNLAGPRVLEHMVDTVLSFEGERRQHLRLLRAVKNRFGATDEVAVFAMGEEGLEQVSNPSSLFLAERESGVPGSVVVAALEGTRPLLVEIQSLVSPAPYGNPRRATSGVDYNRVVLIAAVLEKRAGLQLGSEDIYVNVVGGLRVVEPAADLGIALALASSLRNRPVESTAVAIGEISLTGEVRGVARMDLRLKEAARLGFRRAIIPSRHGELRERFPEVELIGVRTAREALDLAI